MVASIHHAILEKNSEFLLNENVRFCDSLDISKAIKTSSLLITDYSSVWSDFFFLNKPVVFYRPDFDDVNLIENNFILEEEYQAKQDKFFYLKENIGEKILKDAGC